MHSVPITPVGIIKYLQRMANLACSHVCLLCSMADHACSCKAFSDWSNKGGFP